MPARSRSPRAAALQGLDKMRANLALGLAQGIFLPQPRPDRAWLAALGTTIEDAEPVLAANALSASAMWAANAATVSPAPDTADGKCHLTVANLRTMPHRSHEWPATLAQLRLAFAEPAFAVHDPVPPRSATKARPTTCGLRRRTASRASRSSSMACRGGAFPARQHVEASKAIARLHRLDPERDAVRRAVARRRSPPAHSTTTSSRSPTSACCSRTSRPSPTSDAADRRAASGWCRASKIVEVPDAEVPLADAIRSYLFNAQLVTLPDGEHDADRARPKARETPSVWALARAASSPATARSAGSSVVDVRQSMANGGGPACLRLRVVADPATVDPRFLVDEAKLDRIADVIARHWPEQIHHDDLQQPALIADVERARAALLEALDLARAGLNCLVPKRDSRPSLTAI